MKLNKGEKLTKKKENEGKWREITENDGKMT